MSYAFPRDDLRQAILGSIPVETAQHDDQPPQLRFVYAPYHHAPALDPNSALVVGIRGAGKSFWWATLLSPQHRSALSRLAPKVSLPANLEVVAGFGKGISINNAPSARILAELLREYEPSDIWRTVVCRHVLGESEGMPSSSWRDRVQWVCRDIETTERKLEAAENTLVRSGRMKLLIFDALDTAATDWRDLTRILRGLLQIALEFRAKRGIRLKLFVRPDMLNSTDVTSFPDASKLTSSGAELHWTATDLFGLLWQHLGNADEGSEAFRSGCAANFECPWGQIEGVWSVPPRLRQEEKLQRDVFYAIAGEWMGANRKRGLTYTWLPNHLADAYGQTSPRSFQISIRKAAEEALPPGWPYALHHSGIRVGVQAASQIRVQHVNDDFPWVIQVMKPLRQRLTVPCEVTELMDLWRSEGIVARLRSAGDGDRLGPKSIEKGEEGLIDDLTELGILQRLPKQRLQMPDVYRIAFGLGRKGGVPPLKHKQASNTRG